MAEDIKVDEALVKKMAKLSQLKLEDAEIGHYRHQLERILTFMNDLKKVPLTAMNVDNSLQDFDTHGFERPDTVKSSSDPEAVLSQNPTSRSGWFFRVPKILDP